MKAKDIIGRHIEEIHLMISERPPSGPIPLEEILIELKLSSGQIITFPHHPAAEQIELSNFNPELKQVFPVKGIFKSFKKKSLYGKIAEKKIVGLWEIGDGFGDFICGLEFINGYFLVKGPMAPIGLGSADLFLFSSKINLQQRFQDDLKLIYSIED